MEHSISIYARNFNIDPSSYYSITQSNRYISDYKITYRNIVPDAIFTLLNKKNFRKGLGSLVRYFLLAIVSWTKLFIFFCSDLLFVKPDIVFINRDVFPKFRPCLLFGLYKTLLRRSKVIWHVDDNIVDSGEITKPEFEVLLKETNRIITDNLLLRSLIPEKYSFKLTKRVEKISADGDLDRSKVKESIEHRKKVYHREFRVIWLGSASGLKYLVDIIPALEDAARELKGFGKELILEVVSDSPLEIETHFLSVNNVLWSRKSAVDSLYKAHLGLMPLPDTPFSRGKSAFKVTQYKGAGIPSITSDLPALREKMSSGDGIVVERDNELEGWFNAVVELATHFDEWERMSRLALTDIDDHHISAEERAVFYRNLYKDVINE